VPTRLSLAIFDELVEIGFAKHHTTSHLVEDDATFRNQPPNQTDRDPDIRCRAVDIDDLRIS